jgi:hypothetical protein
VPGERHADARAFLAAVKKGRTVASNGALLHLKVGDASPGDVVQMRRRGTDCATAHVLRATFPSITLEVVWNGAVVASSRRIAIAQRRRDAARSRCAAAAGCCCARGTTGRTRRHGHLSLRDDEARVYVRMADQPRRSREAGEYFLRWLGQLQTATERNADYRSRQSARRCSTTSRTARTFYQECSRGRLTVNRKP